MRMCHQVALHRVLFFVVITTILPAGLETSAAAPTDRSKVKELAPLKVPRTPQIVKGQVFVKYNENILQADDLSERARTIERAGKEIQLAFPQLQLEVLKMHVRLGIQLFKIPPGISVEDAVRTIEGHKDVQFSEPNYIVYPQYSFPPDDALWRKGPLELWGMERIGMAQAWQLSDYGGPNPTIVAVIDSGISAHPDLDANMWINPGEIAGNGIDDDGNGIVDDVHGANFCDSPLTPPSGNTDDEPIPHGTMVAGVIGAVRSNGQYVAGVDRTARLMAAKFLCLNGQGKLDGTLEGAISAIDYAVDNKATVLNASWAWMTTPHAGLRLAIERAGRNGALFVAAAGNTSSPQNNNDITPIYPASYGRDGVRNVIAVAGTMLWCASGPDPERASTGDTIVCPPASASPEEVLWDESSYGPLSVHLASPAWWTWTTYPPDGLARPSGTSMAAAHVSGCAALLQGARALSSSTSRFTPTELKTVLMNTGDGLTDLAGKVVGGRRLNCYAALSTEFNIIIATIWLPIVNWFQTFMGP